MSLEESRLLNRQMSRKGSIFKSSVEDLYQDKADERVKKANERVEFKGKKSKVRSNFSKIKQQFSDTRKLVQTTMLKCIWGKDQDIYDTCHVTSCWIPKLYRQVIRGILSLIMLLVGIGYGFIYVTHLPFLFNFWAYLFTFLAIFYSFVGEGKQQCYHQMVKQGRIYFSDDTLKTRIWLRGLIFYTFAIPTSLMSCFIHFVDFGHHLFCNDDEEHDQHRFWCKVNEVPDQATAQGSLTDSPIVSFTKVPHFLQTIFRADKRQSIYEDVALQVKITYYKHQYGTNEEYEASWRRHVIQLAHWLPPIVLAIEFLMNKKRIRFQQIWLYLLFIIFYFSLTMLYEVTQGVPVYQDNLHWYISKTNNAYLYDTDPKEKYVIFPNVIKQSCEHWDSKRREETAEAYGITDPTTYNKLPIWLDSKVACMDMSQKVYCNTGENVDWFTSKNNYVEYNGWANCGFMACTIFFGCFFLYVISYFLHECKAWKTRSFKEDNEHELGNFNDANFRDKNQQQNDDAFQAVDKKKKKLQCTQDTFHSHDPNAAIWK